MKKETWKTLIQILVSILTAIGTTLGVTSCVHGLRTNSHAVGPDGAHRRRFLCEEEKKGGTRWGCLSFVVKDMSQRAWHRVTLCGVLSFIVCPVSAADY